MSSVSLSNNIAKIFRELDPNKVHAHDMISISTLNLSSRNGVLFVLVLVA